MAEATSLVQFLEGIDLEGAPPCEIWDNDEEKKCGKPSIARVQVECGACKGHKPRPRFVCAGCLEWFQDGAIDHIPCGTLITNWRRL